MILKLRHNSVLTRAANAVAHKKKDSVRPMEKKSCDICGRSDKCTLMSSGCAPVTYLACPDCQAARAENADVAVTWIHLEGGPEHAPKHKYRMVVWLGGKYVGWPEVEAYYEASRQTLIEEETGEYVLVDDPISPDEDPPENS